MNSSTGLKNQVKHFKSWASSNVLNFKLVDFQYGNYYCLHCFTWNYDMS